MAQIAVAAFSSSSLQPLQGSVLKSLTFTFAWLITPVVFHRLGDSLFDERGRWHMKMMGNERVLFTFSGRTLI